MSIDLETVETLEPFPIEDLRLGRSRLVLIICALLLAPGLLMINAAFVRGENIFLAAGGAALLLVLIMVRGAWLARDIQDRANHLSLQSNAQLALLKSRIDLEAELRYLAFHDHLTKLANRALFNEQLFGAISRARRNHDVMAIMMMDIDGFKGVNDRLGHAAGDFVLQQVADRLRSSLRKTDAAARLGGDEFAVVLEKAGDVDQIRMVAQRVIEAMEHPIEVVGVEVVVGVSIGIVQSGRGTLDADDLLRRADIAMYEAKSNRTGYVFWEPKMIELPETARSEGIVAADA